MINLEKGGGINLSKDVPGLTKVRFALGWSPNKVGGAPFDLDASAFILGVDASGKAKLLNDTDLVFYNNLASANGAVKHAGDNRVGSDDGDGEEIVVDLTKLSAETVQVSLIVTIHKPHERGQTFGQVPKSYIKLFNAETNEAIANYNLQEDFGNATAVQVGAVYHEGNHEWQFKAVGMGFPRLLDDFVVAYGAGVEKPSERATA